MIDQDSSANSTGRPIAQVRMTGCAGEQVTGGAGAEAKSSSSDGT